jgi:hypothetical protein
MPGRQIGSLLDMDNRGHSKRLPAGTPNLIMTGVFARKNGSIACGSQDRATPHLQP